MSRHLMPTSELTSDFPFSLATLYSGRSRGQFKWLTREGPDGHRGRILWIIVDEFNLYCRARGLKFRLEMGEDAR